MNSKYEKLFIDKDELEKLKEDQASTDAMVRMAEKIPDFSFLEAVVEETFKLLPASNDLQRKIQHNCKRCERLDEKNI